MNHRHARAAALALTLAAFLTLSSCKAPLASAAQTAPAEPAITPMPAAPPIDVFLLPNYSALIQRDFGDHNEQLDAIQKQIASTSPDFGWFGKRTVDAWIRAGERSSSLPVFRLRAGV